MTDTRIDLARLLPELYTEERCKTRAPDTEEILTYLTGGLSSAEEEKFQERLAFHPTAAKRLLDLADPSRIEADDEVLPELDREALRSRLKEEGLFERSTTVVPFRPRGVHPAYRWATAALLVLSIGLASQLLRQPVSMTSADNVAVWELLPRAESTQRGDDQAVEATPGFSHDLVLYAPEIVPGVVYQLVVVDAKGRETYARKARTRARGRLVLRLHPKDLAPGRYEVRLLESGASEPLAVYPFEWR